MKNLLIILLFIPLISFGQTYRNPNPKPIKIEVSQAPKTSADHLRDMQNKISESFAGAANNYAANAQARVNNSKANAEAMKDNYTKITSDVLINNDGVYKAIVLDKISGWMPKNNIKSITEILENSTKMRFYKSRNKVPKSLRSSDKILFFSWVREAVDDYTRITNITVRNSKGQILYDVVHKNKQHIEMLKPFTSSYTFDKEMVLKKLKELRELKDLEVISKEEYDLYVKKYKSIILKGF